MATKQDVSFGNPATLIAPDLAVAQQQIARKQAIIDAMRSQSLSPIDAGRGSVSWTQGLAKMLDAYAANSMQKRNDAQAIDINRQYASRLAPMFGASAPAPSGPNPYAPTPAPSPSPSPQPPTADNGPLPAMPPVNPSPAASSPQDAPPVTPSLPAGQPPAPATAPMPSAAPSYPMALTGNPQQDMGYYIMDPEDYTKAVIAAHAPVDMARTVQQARMAMANGDYATAAALLQSVQKQNYIAPVSVRQGGAVIDPITHQPVFENPRLPVGASATYGPDGRPTGVQMIPGAPQTIATEAAAQSGGKAAGQAPYDLVTAYDPQGNPYYVQKSAMVSGGGVGAGPGAPAGAVGRAGPPIGATSAANVTGANSAQGFQQISDMAADVPNRLLALNQMTQLVNKPETVLGPGSNDLAHLKGILSTFAPGLSQPTSVTNAAEFNKWAAQYSARTAQEMGLSGSDSRLALAVHATPNGEMTKGALGAIIPQMVSFENAKAGMATAATQWQQQYGPASLQQFRVQWNQNYDPRIYTWMAQGPKYVRDQMAQLRQSNPADYRELVRKATVLGNIGALPR